MTFDEWWRRYGGPAGGAAAEREVVAHCRAAWGAATKAAVARAELVRKCYADSAKDFQARGMLGDAIKRLIQAEAAGVVATALQTELKGG